MGFASVLREAGVSDQLIVREGTAPVSHDHGARTISTLLERAPDVEAVFAVSDISAFGALMECHRRGIKVPEQLSLMGFGDFDIARQSVPAITTIRVDAVGIGVKTGELLLNVFDKGDADTQSLAPSLVDVGFKLIERQTASCRSS